MKLKKFGILVLAAAVPTVIAGGPFCDINTVKV